MNPILITIKSGNQIVKIRVPEEKKVKKKKEPLLDDNIPGVSEELRKNRQFLKLFNKYIAEFNFFCSTKTKIPPGIVVTDDGACQQTFNETKWESEKETAFKDMLKENIELLMIHVSGKIEEEQKDKIIDQIYRQLPPIPLCKFKTKNEKDTTLVEILVFGSEPILKEKEDDYESME